MYTILSIDGGGIRGIIPGQVLVTLEEKLTRKISQNPALQAKFPTAPRLSDFFDFIAGTSTGGILTSLYLGPTPNNPVGPASQRRQHLICTWIMATRFLIFPSGRRSRPAMAYWTKNTTPPSWSAC
jgi:patatin-like phospholipase/acyl hydrolase